MNDLLLYMVIGMRIRDIREGLGMTQSELAERAGIGRTTLVNIEAGKQKTALHHLYKIAEYLGVPIYSLLPETDRYDGISIREKFQEFLKKEFENARV